MGSVKDQAVVLRRLDYSEHSQVLAFFTRAHGLQRLIAKGIKRGTRQRFATGIDLLEHGEAVFLLKAQVESGLGLLTEWRQTEAYLGLRRRLDCWYAGQYAAEITTAMNEPGDAHPELFDALTALLSSLSTGGEVLALLSVYQREVLTSAGLWPDLTRCVMCDLPAPPGRAGYYSARQGGLICRGCEPGVIEKRRVPGAVLDTLRGGREDPPCPPLIKGGRDFSCPPLVTGGQGARSVGEVFELLDYTIGEHISRPVGLGRSLREITAGRVPAGDAQRSAARPRRPPSRSGG